MSGHDEEPEGGWALACSHGTVVCTTGKHVFHGAAAGAAAKSVSHAGKPIRTVAWGVDGAGRRWCFTAGDDKVVEARDAETLEVVHKSAALQKKIGQLCYVAGHSKIVIGDKTGEVFEAAFDAAKGFGEATFLLGHTASMITGISSALGGKVVVTTDKDEHVRVSRYPNSGVIERFCFGHSGFVSALVNVRDDVIATGGGDGLLKVWSLPSGDCVFEDEFPNATVNSLAVAKNAAGADVLAAAVEGVGIVLYTIGQASFGERTVVAGPTPIAISSSDSTLFAAYIGDSTPLFKKFSITATSLEEQPFALPETITEVKPSYWQV